jgi:penicillin-binding protein 2
VKRVYFIIGFIFLFFLLLVFRIYSISIKTNTYYEELAKRNVLKQKVLKPVRGIIYDRNRVPLVVNNLGFSISIKPHLSYKSRTKDLEYLIDTIVRYFPHRDKAKLLKKYRRDDSAYVHENIKIIDFVSFDDFAHNYAQLNMIEGIFIDSAIKRQYPYKETAAHVVGYVGKISRKEKDADPMNKYLDYMGKSGLEKYYNDYLRGELGYKQVKVDAYAKELEVLEILPPKHNNDIVTSIDIRLQSYINTIFDKKSGTVIVMNADNGRILSSGSYPEYDNNLFVNGISLKEWIKIRDDLNHTFTNKLINGLYPPGSVVKMGVALSFLENGISPKKSVNCEGSYELGGRNFRCWKEKGHKFTNMKKAIRESCDDYFYKFSQKVGIEKIAGRLSELGFGQRSGIDLPNEYYGINPSRTWKRKRYDQPWYIGETLIASIGQGYFLVTPMQIARYTAFLATGKLPVPHYRIDDASLERTQFAAKKIEYNKQHMKIIREGMYDVCNHPYGTASRHIRVKRNIKVAGKTGTAQVVGIPQSEKKRMKEHELEYYHRSHAWLTTYAPYKNPKYVVSVMVEHGGHGGSAGGVIVSKIYNKMYDLGYFDD